MVVSREIGFRARHSHHGMITEPSHGHDYVVRLTMEGELNEEGFLCDFRAVKRIFTRLVARPLNNSDLDEIFEYPTAENLSVWIWQKMSPYLPLRAVEVREKPHSSVVYRGPANHVIPPQFHGSI